MTKPNHIFIQPKAVATETTPTGADVRELQRLAAVFPENERSACRACSRWIGPAGRWIEKAGWRLCGACEDDIINGEGGTPEQRAWSHLLRDEVTEDEARWLTIDGIGAPWFASRPEARADEPGNDKRWQHIDSDVIVKAKRLLRERRNIAGISVSDTSLPCGMCGCRYSVGGWTMSNMTVGHAKAARWPICRLCMPYYSAAGMPIAPADLSLHALGAALGLTRAGRPAAAPVGSVDIRFKVFAAMSPTASTPGSDEPWLYAAESLPKIRRTLGAEFPTKITLTDAEKAEIARLRAEKAAGDALDAAREARRISVLG